MKSKLIKMRVNQVRSGPNRFKLTDEVQLLGSVHGADLIGGLYVAGKRLSIITGKAEIRPRKRGRKPNIERKVAKVLCFGWLKLRKYSDGEAYRRIGRLFKLRDARELQRECRIGWKEWSDMEGSTLAYSGTSSQEFSDGWLLWLDPASAVTLRPDGRPSSFCGAGWLWLSWQTEAKYDHWSGEVIYEL